MAILFSSRAILYYLKTMQTRPVLWLSLALSILVLAMQWPLWKAYQSAPHIALLAWDPAIHARDGYSFYLQLTRFDWISFFYSLINLSYWMPCHPLILAATTFFTGYSVIAYTFINFLSLALAMGWVTVLIARGSGTPTQRGTHLAVLFLFLIRFVYSKFFLGTHLTIMIESWGAAVLLVFFVSVLEPEPTSLHRKSALWSLLGLFLTKVQYGLFFLPVFVFQNRLTLLADLRAMIQLARPKSWATGVAAAFLFFGFFIFVASFYTGSLLPGVGRPDGIWAMLFAVLIWITFQLRAVKRAGITIQVPLFWKALVLPYGYFYLFPFRHKIRYLLENVVPAGQAEPLSDRALSFFHFFGEGYLNSHMSVAIAATLVCLALSGFGRKVTRTWIWGMFFLFYLPMSLFNGNRDPRHMLPLALLVLVGLAQGLARLPVVRWLAIGFGLFVVVDTAQSFSSADTTAWVEKIHLAPELNHVDHLLQTFHFDETGIIYGLGQSMDQTVMIEDLTALLHHPENSNVLLKRLDRQLVVHDFGRGANDRPAETLLHLAANSKMKQVLVFDQGFSANDLQTIQSELTTVDHFQLIEQNQDFRYFVR